MAQSNGSRFEDTEVTRLKGRTAVITGGSSGIGLATARRLLQEGARVLFPEGAVRHWIARRNRWGPAFSLFKLTPGVSMSPRDF